MKKDTNESLLNVASLPSQNLSGLLILVANLIFLTGSGRRRLQCKAGNYHPRYASLVSHLYLL